MKKFLLVAALLGTLVACSDNGGAGANETKDTMTNDAGASGGTQGGTNTTPMGSGANPTTDSTQSTGTGGAPTGTSGGGRSDSSSAKH